MRKSFDSEFGNSITRIERYTCVFNDEITLAYRQRQNAANKNLKNLVQSVSVDNKTFKFEVESREMDRRSCSMRCESLNPLSKHNLLRELRE